MPGRKVHGCNIHKTLLSELSLEPEPAGLVDKQSMQKQNWGLSALMGLVFPLYQSKRYCRKGDKIKENFRYYQCYDELDVFSIESFFRQFGVGVGGLVPTDTVAEDDNEHIEYYESQGDYDKY
jgi:hypothetical protein